MWDNDKSYFSLFYRTFKNHLDQKLNLPDDIDGSGGSPIPLLLLLGPPIILVGRVGGPFWPNGGKLFGFDVWIGGVGIGRCGGGPPEFGPFDKLPAGPPSPFICPGWVESPPGPRGWLLRIELLPFRGPQLPGPVVGGIPFGRHWGCGGIPFGICGSFEKKW